MAAAVCVDASVALLWLLDGDLAIHARLLRRRCAERDAPMLAPPLFRPEVTSVIRRWAHTGHVAEEDAREALARSLRFPVIITDAGDALQERAYVIACELNLPRAYDSQYIALAEFNGSEFWTADRRLANGARRSFPLVRWLGDYKP